MDNLIVIYGEVCGGGEVGEGGEREIQVTPRLVHKKGHRQLSFAAKRKRSNFKNPAGIKGDAGCSS